MPDGPGGFLRGSTCPAVLRNHWKENCIFTYGAVTLFGRPFQTVRLTRLFPRLTSWPNGVSAAPPRDYYGPTTPGSPRGSPGLGCSDFARRYFRNHCCFLFLWVLRWFTSPGLLRTPMYSAHDDRCSHRPGFPIRTSPDHSLPAAPRSISSLSHVLHRLLAPRHPHACP